MKALPLYRIEKQVVYLYLSMNNILAKFQRKKVENPMKMNLSVQNINTLNLN